MKRIKWVVIGLAVLAIAGCSGTGEGGPTAVANLEATKGNATTGTVTFRQSGSRVIVTAEINNLKPNAEHGFHVHDKGDCSSGDGMSAAGHFNPLGKPHGNHTVAERHAGDMPNIKADANGRATYRAELDVITVSDGPTSVVGRGLIVHRDPDDYTSQPVGNAGPRLACAVIRRS